MIVLDGKKVSAEIIENLKNEIIENNMKLGFAVIWIGNNSASEIYVNNKIRKCNEVGIKTELYHLEEDVKEQELIKLIDKLNSKNDINGILIQSPVPKQIDYNKCVNMIDPVKDIDGFSNVSVGNLYMGLATHISCTPKGIIKLLDYYNIPLEGKNVCIINRTNIVGKPLFHLLISRNATVTMCHSKTRNLKFFTENADIVISAVGKQNFITEDMIKNGAIVIDVGISRVLNEETGKYKVVGDVDYENVSKKASYITPVPGGVGPMTIAMVLDNIVNTERKDTNGYILKRSIK